MTKAIKKIASIYNDLRSLFLSNVSLSVKARLGACFLCYTAKYSLAKITHKAITKEKLLNFSVNFLDYGNFYDQFREIFLRNSYYFKSARQKPLVLDCGANIGMATLYFKSLYPQSEIIAFEPDAINFAILSKNIATNGFSKDVKLVNAALWPDDGGVTLYGKAGDLWRVELKTTAKDAACRRVDAVAYAVPSVRLAEYIETEVDFMKMDIEGAEFLVIRDSENTLPKVKEVVLEFHGHPDNPPNSLLAMQEIFSRHGFLCEIVDCFRGIYRFKKTADIA